MTFKRGTQIAFVPARAGGNLTHESVEYGFVTSVQGTIVWCRFWDWNGKLRTKDSSYAVPVDYLVPLDTVEQSVVEEWLVVLK
jgi:hypothetical protein